MVTSSHIWVKLLTQLFSPPSYVPSLHFQADAAPPTSSNKPEALIQPVNEGTPVSGQPEPACSQTASCSSASSTPGAAQLPVGSQALRDLMDLAEDGMTLTQYGYSSKGNAQKHIHRWDEGTCSSKWPMLTPDVQNLFYLFMLLKCSTWKSNVQKCIFVPIGPIYCCT